MTSLRLILQYGDSQCDLVDAGVIVCNVFVDFRAKSHDLMRHDRGWATLTAVEVDGVWKISSFEMPEQEVLTTAQPAFADVTAEAGLDTVPLFERLKHFVAVDT